MNICLFKNDEISSPLSLSDDRAQHILHILHKKEGDTFSAGIINGKAGHAKIKEINAENGKLFFEFTAESDGKPLFPLSMIIGFPRPIQLRRLLRDMASLGVSEVHLTGTELGEKSYMKSALATTEAAKDFLLAGSVQASSTHIPSLFIHTNLKDCLTSLDLSGSLFALDNVSPSKRLSSALTQKPKKAVAAIGSERGWTDSERALLKQHSFELLGLGKRILRTETAATAAVALILNAMDVLD